MKASINGPNRRRNRVGDETKASNFDNESSGGDTVSVAASAIDAHHASKIKTMRFKVRSLETYLEQQHCHTKDNDNGSSLNGDGTGSESIGDACLFTVGKGGGNDSDSGYELLKEHFLQMNQTSLNPEAVSKNDPLLIHFHDLPIFVLKAMPICQEEQQDQDQCTGIGDSIIYLSQAHCHNNKICEDTSYPVTCCSRPEPTSTTTGTRIGNYDKLSAVQIEVFLRYSSDEHKYTEGKECQKFQAHDIAKILMNNSLFSVLTVNECLIVTINGTDLVCRVSRVDVIKDKDDAILGLVEDDDNNNGDNDKNGITSAEASLDEPYRGRVTVNTEFYVEPSNPDAVHIQGSRSMPEGTLPEDVIHVTTSDNEWFPVRRVILASCINLTKYVQAGRGKYKDSCFNKSDRSSEDAPDGGIHCNIDIDCCTFDRILIFIMSQLYPDEYRFALELSEANSLSSAATKLGLMALSDLCASQLSSFASRVRKDTYIRFSEVKKRNEGNELLIIVDGMVLDISRWIDEHPGGPSIIPTQALNIDCTCFFEMYHVSRQAFLYLKSFYIGELNPADLAQLKGNDIEASKGFLHSLRSYTDQWRVEVEEQVDEHIHKSL